MISLISTGLVRAVCFVFFLFFFKVLCFLIVSSHLLGFSKKEELWFLLWLKAEFSHIGGLFSSHNFYGNR